MKYLSIVLLILLSLPLMVVGQDKAKGTRKNMAEEPKETRSTRMGNTTAPKDTTKQSRGDIELTVGKKESFQSLRVSCDKSENGVASVPLITNEGTVLGSYEPSRIRREGEESRKGNLRINGREISTTSLSNALVSHDGLSIIVYGDSPHSHRGGSVLFEIYGLDGQLKASLIRSCFVNCVGPVTDLSGNIYIAGHLQDNNDGASLVCYSSDGTEQWKTRIPEVIHPVSIHVSPSGKNVIVRGNGTDFNSVQVIIDARSGLPLPFISDSFTFSNFEFIDDDHVVQYNRLRWSIVDLNSSTKVLETGQFKNDHGPSISSTYLGASKQLMTLHLSSNATILRLVGTESRKTTVFELQGVSFSGSRVNCYERSTGEIVLVAGSEICIVQLP